MCLQGERNTKILRLSGREKWKNIRFIYIYGENFMIKIAIDFLCNYRKNIQF